VPGRAGRRAEQGKAESRVTSGQEGHSSALFPQGFKLFIEARTSFVRVLLVNKEILIWEYKYLHLLGIRPLALASYFRMGLLGLERCMNKTTNKQIEIVSREA
jgi:hypothetical protein